MAITKQNFIERVLLIMNEAGLTNKNEQAYIGADTTQIDRHIESAFVEAWRRCAKSLPKEWLATERFDYYPKVENIDDGTGYIILPHDYYLLSSLKLKGWTIPIHEAFFENDRIASIQTNVYTRGSDIRPVGVIATKRISNKATEIYYFQENEPPAGIVIDHDELLWFNTLTNRLYKLVSTKHPIVFSWEYHSLDNIQKGHIFKHDEQKYILSNISNAELTLDSINIQDNIAQVLKYYSVQKGKADAHDIDEAFYVPIPTPLTELSSQSNINVSDQLLEPLAYLVASTVFTIFEKDTVAKALDAKAVEMLPQLASVRGANVSYKQ